MGKLLDLRSIAKQRPPVKNRGLFCRFPPQSRLPSAFPSPGGFWAFAVSINAAQGRAPVRQKYALFSRRYAHFTVSVAAFVTVDCPPLFFTIQRN